MSIKKQYKTNNKCSNNQRFSPSVFCATGRRECFVSYAYDQGYAKGVSKNKFGANDTVTSEMYLTFMLRALGYTEGDRGEFGWNSPWGLAAWCGILPIQMDRNHFLRADVASVTCAALYAKRRGSERTLQEQLVSEGAFTAEQFVEAFPSDPFAEFRRIDQKVTEAIVAQRPVGQIDYNKCLLENHMITSIVEADGELDITAMVCLGSATLEPAGHVSSTLAGSEPWRIVLDAKTLELKSFQENAELLDQWVPLESTAAYNKHYDSLNFGLNRTFFVQLQQLLDHGAIAYRSPTYEDAMKDLKNTSFYREA